MEDDIIFFKSIVDSETFNQYDRLKEYEDYLNNNTDNAERFKLEGCALILYKAIADILISIKNEEKILNRNRLITIFNYNIYRFRKLFKITEKDENLENFIKLFNYEIKVEYLCLNELRNLLIRPIKSSEKTEFSKIYIYHEGLVSLQRIIDKYLNKVFVINDSNSKNIYVEFNDKTNINDTLNNIEKVKSFIFSYKNNQENS